MTVAEASATVQTAADKKNALDATLRDLHATERALTDQIGRAIADGADPKALSGPKAERDTIRDQIEDAESAQVHVDADATKAEVALKAAQKAERQTVVQAAIDAARAKGVTYSSALAAFVSARSAMRTAASALPGVEAPMVQLVEDVVTFQLHGTPSNPAYAKAFSDLVEPYLQQAAAV
jgi:chromosome segregation ATPase